MKERRGARAGVPRPVEVFRNRSTWLRRTRAATTSRAATRGGLRNATAGRSEAASPRAGALSPRAPIVPLPGRSRRTTASARTADRSRARPMLSRRPTAPQCGARNPASCRRTSAVPDIPSLAQFDHNSTTRGRRSQGRCGVFPGRLGRSASGFGASGRICGLGRVHGTSGVGASGRACSRARGSGRIRIR